jgi:hypothetical protein
LADLAEHAAVAAADDRDPLRRLPRGGQSLLKYDVLYSIVY